MAVKNSKATTPPDLVEQSAAPLISEINLEDAIADELLNNIDWAKVRSVLLKKAPAKLFAWLVSGDNTPINISAFPELSVLSSADEQEKAA
jgi:hypothetical protein